MRQSGEPVSCGSDGDQFEAYPPVEFPSASHLELPACRSLTCHRLCVFVPVEMQGTSWPLQGWDYKQIQLVLIKMERAERKYRESGERESEKSGGERVER